MLVDTNEAELTAIQVVVQGIHPAIVHHTIKYNTIQYTLNGKILRSQSKMARNTVDSAISWAHPFKNPSHQRIDESAVELWKG